LADCVEFTSRNPPVGKSATEALFLHPELPVASVRYRVAQPVLPDSQ
jgi:hypothetical protein